MTSLPIHFRGPTPSDLPFVMSSWRLSMRRDYAGVAAEDYRLGATVLIERRLSAKDAALVVGVDPADHGQIYGYLVASKPNVIHWVYVKEQMRGMGLAKLLVRQLWPDVTTKLVATSQFRPHVAGRRRVVDVGIEYNPFL